MGSLLVRWVHLQVEQIPLVIALLLLWLVMICSRVRIAGCRDQAQTLQEPASSRQYAPDWFSLRGSVASAAVVQIAWIKSRASEWPSDRFRANPEHAYKAVFRICGKH